MGKRKQVIYSSDESDTENISEELRSVPSTSSAQTENSQISLLTDAITNLINKMGESTSTGSDTLRKLIPSYDPEKSSLTIDQWIDSGATTTNISLVG